MYTPGAPPPWMSLPSERQSSDARLAEKLETLKKMREKRAGVSSSSSGTPSPSPYAPRASPLIAKKTPASAAPEGAAANNAILPPPPVVISQSTQSVIKTFSQMLPPGPTGKTSLSSSSSTQSLMRGFKASQTPNAKAGPLGSINLMPLGSTLASRQETFFAQQSQIQQQQREQQMQHKQQQQQQQQQQQHQHQHQHQAESAQMNLHSPPTSADSFFSQPGPEDAYAAGDANMTNGSFDDSISMSTSHVAIHGQVEEAFLTPFAAIDASPARAPPSATSSVPSVESDHQYSAAVNAPESTGGFGENAAVPEEAATDRPTEDSPPSAFSGGHDAFQRSSVTPRTPLAVPPSHADAADADPSTEAGAPVEDEEREADNFWSQEENAGGFSISYGGEAADGEEEFVDDDEDEQQQQQQQQEQQPEQHHDLTNVSAHVQAPPILSPPPLERRTSDLYVHPASNAAPPSPSTNTNPNTSLSSSSAPSSLPPPLTPVVTHVNMDSSSVKKSPPSPLAASPPLVQWAEGEGAGVNTSGYRPRADSIGSQGSAGLGSSSWDRPPTSNAVTSVPPPIGGSSHHISNPFSSAAASAPSTAPSLSSTSAGAGSMLSTSLFNPLSQGQYSTSTSSRADEPLSVGTTDDVDIEGEGSSRRRAAPPLTSHYPPQTNANTSFASPSKATQADQVVNQASESVGLDVNASTASDRAVLSPLVAGKSSSLSAGVASASGSDAVSAAGVGGRARSGSRDNHTPPPPFKDQEAPFSPYAPSPRREGVNDHRPSGPASFLSSARASLSGAAASLISVATPNAGTPTPNSTTPNAATASASVTPLAPGSDDIEGDGGDGFAGNYGGGSHGAINLSDMKINTSRHVNTNSITNTTPSSSSDTPSSSTNFHSGIAPVQSSLRLDIGLAPDDDGSYPLDSDNTMAHSGHSGHSGLSNLSQLDSLAGLGGDASAGSFGSPTREGSMHSSHSMETVRASHSRGDTPGAPLAAGRMNYLSPARGAGGASIGVRESPGVNLQINTSNTSSASGHTGNAGYSASSSSAHNSPYAARQSFADYGMQSLEGGSREGGSSGSPSRSASNDSAGRVQAITNMYSNPNATSQFSAGIGVAMAAISGPPIAAQHRSFQQPPAPFQSYQQPSYQSHQPGYLQTASYDSANGSVNSLSPTANSANSASVAGVPAIFNPLILHPPAIGAMPAAPPSPHANHAYHDSFDAEGSVISIEGEQSDVEPWDDGSGSDSDAENPHEGKRPSVTGSVIGASWDDTGAPRTKAPDVSRRDTTHRRASFPLSSSAGFSTSQSKSGAGPGASGSADSNESASAAQQMMASFGYTPSNGGSSRAFTTTKNSRSGEGKEDGGLELQATRMELVLTKHLDECAARESKRRAFRAWLALRARVAHAHPSITGAMPPSSRSAPPMPSSMTSPQTPSRPPSGTYYATSIGAPPTNALAAGKLPDYLPSQASATASSVPFANTRSRVMRKVDYVRGLCVWKSLLLGVLLAVLWAECGKLQAGTGTGTSDGNVGAVDARERDRVRERYRVTN